jgi:hypothetical protein
MPQSRVVTIGMNKDGDFVAQSQADGSLNLLLRR